MASPRRIPLLTLAVSTVGLASCHVESADGGAVSLRKLAGDPSALAKPLDHAGECVPDDPCAGAEGVGEFVLEHCDAPTGSLVFQNMTCEQAVQNCEFNQAFNPGQSIYCEWNGMEVDRVESKPGACDDEFGPALPPCDEEPPQCVPADPCEGAEGVGEFFLDHCDDPGGSLLFQNMTCEQALQNCGFNQAFNPGQSIYCEWDGMEIDRVESEPGACDKAHGPAPTPCSDDDPCDDDDDDDDDDGDDDDGDGDGDGDDDDDDDDGECDDDDDDDDDDDGDDDDA